MCKTHTKQAEPVTEVDPYESVSAQEAAFTVAMRDFYGKVEWEYVDGQIEIDKRKERERVYAILLIFLTNMHDAGYANGYERLRVAVPSLPPVPVPLPAESPAFVFAKEEAKRASRSIVDTIAEEMNAAASKAKEEGFAPAEVKEAAQAKLDDLKEVGPERVASTETVKAFNEGTIQAWEDSGVVAELQWHTQEDARVCPFCEAMDNMTTPDGVPFFRKGEVLSLYTGIGIGPAELQMVFDYGDMNGPPLHPFCRCYLDFVLKE